MKMFVANLEHVIMIKFSLILTKHFPNFPLQNDTMKIVFMYHEKEPKRGSVVIGSLPSPSDAFKQVRPLLLTQRAHHDRLQLANNNKIQALELRNQDVKLPGSEETLYWCAVFKLSDITRKHHIIKVNKKHFNHHFGNGVNALCSLTLQYEPVFESTSSISYINQMILYECQEASPELEIMSRNSGRPCYEPDNTPLKCNAIVAAWARGSEVSIFFLFFYRFSTLIYFGTLAIFLNF